MSRGIKLLLVCSLLTLPAGTAASVDADEIPHRTSWLGETLLPEDAAYTDTGSQYPKRRVVQTQVASIWVDPDVADGKIYTNSVYDESARETGVYQFDAAKRAIRPSTWLYRQGAGGTVVTGDEKYFYADFTQGKDNPGQVLVRFQRGTTPEDNPYIDGSIPMSRFPGGDPVASEWTAGRKLTGKPGGVATGLGLVFVTRPEENAIYVFEREGMTLVAKNPARNPGAVTFRASTSSLFVLSDDGANNRVVQEWKVQPSGAMSQGATITDVGTTPVALAANSSRLFIADDGPQQVRIYGNCGICPEKHLLLDKLGKPGGVVTNNGLYADDRFDNLTGVGVDKSGNVYVAANGRGAYGRLDIRRFSPLKTLDGKLMNYIFQDAVVPDPRNPADVYSAYQKFTLDYSRTTPGQEWSPNKTQLTVNRAACPHDGRNPMPGTGATFQTQAVALRHLRGSDGVERKYLFVRPTGSAFYNLGIYRFDSNGVARPSVLFSEGVNPWPDGTPAATGHRQKWVDANGNCRMDAGEISEMTGTVQYISYAHSIDQRGDIWGAGVNPKIVHHFRLGSFDAANNPQHENGRIIELPEAPMDRIQQVHYVAETDTMYMYGYRGSPPDANASPRYVLARYDNFNDPAKRKLAWQVDMNYIRCWSGHPYNLDFCFPYGLATAGNRVYVADQATNPGEIQGRVRVFDATSGAYKGSLYAGPEVTRTAGWVDIAVTGITATRLPSGEHVVFREEDYLGRVLMYRYPP